MPVPTISLLYMRHYVTFKYPAYATANNILLLYMRHYVTFKYPAYMLPLIRTYFVVFLYKLFINSAIAGSLWSDDASTLNTIDACADGKSSS